MYSRLAHGSTTSQTFWGVDNTNTGGVLGVYVDGVLHTGDTLSADNDYTGIVTVTGLTSGEHTWQMALAGVATGTQKTFSTMPAEGENFDVVIIGDATGDCQAFGTIVGKESPAFGISVGDTYYLDVNPNFADRCTCGQLHTTGIVLATELAIYRCKHRCHYTKAYFRPLAMAAFPWYLQWHNHEFEVQPFQTSTGTNAGIKFNAAYQAACEYMFSGGPDRPVGYDSYPSYGGISPNYYTWVTGSARFIVCDNTSYGMDTGTARSHFEGTVPNDSGGNNVGSMQLDWLNAVITAATEPFIILITPAEPIDPSAGATASNDWTAIYNILDAAANRNKTIMLFCGDTHQALAELIGGAFSTIMPNSSMLVVNATPMEHPARGTASTVMAANNNASIYFRDTQNTAVLWAASQSVLEYDWCYYGSNMYSCTVGGTTGATPPTHTSGSASDGTITWTYEGRIDQDALNYNYAVLSVNPAGTSELSAPHIKVQIKNAITGATRWSCLIEQGSRIPFIRNNGIARI